MKNGTTQADRSAETLMQADPRAQHSREKTLVMNDNTDIVNRWLI